MTKIRRIEITVENRFLVLRQQKNQIPVTAVWCSRCPVPCLLITPDEAALLAGVSTRAIYHRVETEQLHFTETPEGRLLICPNSLTR
jgi:hypothetical protein